MFSGSLFESSQSLTFFKLWNTGGYFFCCARGYEECVQIRILKINNLKRDFSVLGIFFVVLSATLLK